MRSNAARIPERGDEGVRHPAGPAPHETGAAQMAARAPAPFTILLAVPTLDNGAAEAGVIDAVRILCDAGQRAIVVSRGGRREAEVNQAGGEWVKLDVGSINPAIMLANVPRLARLIRRRGCDIVHAHGRAPAWSGHVAARMTGRPFVTTWHKGFREQNPLKRLYNSVMVRGDRVVAVSAQIADLIGDRYRMPAERLRVIPAGIDPLAFDPAAIAPGRIEEARRIFGVGPNTKVALVVGRMLRRKGHHVVVQAVQRLKSLGVKDFVCVFASEEAGTRYAEELWDQVLASDVADVIRLVGPLEDVAAAYAASTVMVSAAVQPEGLQRAILEAQAMACPVIASDLGAGADVVLAPPSVPEERMTGLRFPAGDDAALAAALVRVFCMSEPERRAIGARGRAWVATHFNPETVARETLGLYAGLIRGRAGADLSSS